MKRSKVTTVELDKIQKLLVTEKDKCITLNQQADTKIIEIQKDNQALQSRMRQSHEQHRNEMKTLQQVLQQLSEVTYLLLVMYVPSYSNYEFWSSKMYIHAVINIIK